MQATIKNNTQHLDAAAQILSDPALITAHVGPRKSLARSLTSFLVTVSLGAATVFGAMDLAFQQSLFHEVETLVSPNAPITPSAVQAQAPSPLHPILQVGLDETGRLDLPRLLSSWHRAGLDAYGAKLMLVAIHGQGALFQGNDDDMSSFQLHQVATQEQLTRLFSVLGGDPSKLAPPPEDFTVPGWAPSVYNIWSALIREEGLDESLVDYDQPVDPAYAQQEIMRAIDEAGLASLRLPLSAHANPARMLGYARAISQVNQDMGRVTGWGGQALGLAGRVHLELTPRSASVEGETWVDNGRVMVSSNWPSISHEWLHAVDFTLANHAFKRPSYSGTSSEQLGVFRQRSAGGHVAHAHSDLLEAITQADPEWVSNMKAIDKSRDQKYFSTPSEMLSRSFEVFISNELGPDGFSAVALDRQHRETYPGPDQANQQARAWKSWFSNLNSLALTTPEPVSSYASFGDALRQHRQGPALAAAAREHGVAIVDGGPAPAVRGPATR